MKKNNLRSNCPINFVIEIIGDKWSLLVIRDLVFEGKKFFKDFLNAKEGIATNILSARLKNLEQAEIIKSEVYERKRNMKVYALTDRGKDLIPILMEMIAWSSVHGDELDVNSIFVEKYQANREPLLKQIRACIGTTTFSSNQTDKNAS